MSTDLQVIREINSICQVFTLTPEQVKFKWESYALNANISLKPTISYVKLLRNALQREFDRTLKKRRTGPSNRTVTKRSIVPMDLSEYGIDFGLTTQEQDNSMFSTSSIEAVDTKLSQATSQFLNRPESHQIDGQYNGQLLRRGVVMNERPQIDLKHLQKPIEPYRYMFEKIREKADEMNDRLDFMGQLLSDKLHEKFSAPIQQSQVATFTFGRICSDASEGKLNAESVMLETSKELGMGKRIKLDLSKLQDYSLFPGQIVGVQGFNRNGNSFQVECIHMPPLPQKINPANLELISNGGKPIEIITAAGPFTLDGDLSFKPLESLIQMCMEERPDIVLLMGPFVSAKHPLIAKGKITTLPEDLFREQVEVKLKHLLDACSNTQVLLLPHADDIIQTYPLFPQPPLKDLQHPRIHLLSNPSSISVNGHVVSLANIDVLFRLAKQEIFKSSVHSDRFSRLVQHLIQQHTYYPLFPHAEEDSIDSSRLLDIQISWKPDILIIPSQFKYFVKAVMLE
ncbi:hypothetical protein RO3G_05252 [Rhizopus delemar RA 99-880]|uniref:DNA polymerase alpha subunit B n=1 Tax=Rhizopus delemar (strain RA 99-880 / ATCC MYA-4621 / FGSC 9543 / NRRL 43880) TaxID=246409 RepID=I1BWG7_RHIO9|nr:hypothetical protein RO3G_05252 [Rhizopus delemar RA 99-880]|eukprot:EIE80547.1 hypothetical protein RO3G_05252 [Rhizopus delemar RA 99-880]